jgi:DNA-binding transcriptional LysR family regulator
MEGGVEWTERIGRRVKLRDLHVLLTVAQSGSMTRAAELLAISKPVVSKTISDLEHALGVRLLDRTSAGVEPTAYGRAFLNCGTAVFDDLRRGVQEIEYLSDPTVGELRIGAPTPFTDGLIPAVLARLAERFPRIVVHAVEGDTAVLCRMLRERKIDLAVGRTWGSAGGDEFSTEPLFDEHLFVVASLDSPWSRRRKVELAELLDEPWTMPELDTVVGALIVEGFRSAGLALPAAQIVSNSMAVRTRLVATGRFLTMLSSSIVHFGAERLLLKILPVTLPLRSQPAQIMTLKDRTPKAIARLFTDELRIVTQPLRNGAAVAAKVAAATARTPD